MKMNMFSANYTSDIRKRYLLNVQKKRRLFKQFLVEAYSAAVVSIHCNWKVVRDGLQVSFHLQWFEVWLKESLLT